MARVTVEDCIDKVPNRFGLVLLAAHRARAISAGGQILVDRDNDKNPVVALREIADDVVDPEELREGADRHACSASTSIPRPRKRPRPWRCWPIRRICR